MMRLFSIFVISLAMIWSTLDRHERKIRALIDVLRAPPHGYSSRPIEAWEGWEGRQWRR